MDTSISKALIMVAGILLAMIIIGFATYTFQHLSTWSTTQEDEYETQEAQKFNKEYEAYQKDLMYGVDVISCLNKAKSNNQKVDKGVYDVEYLVTVHVTFQNELEESIRVYYIDSSNKANKNGEKEAYNTSVFKQTPLKNVKDLFEMPSDYVTKMSTYTPTEIKYHENLKPVSGKLKNMKKGIGNAYNFPKVDDKDELLEALLEISGNLKQVKKNAKWNLTDNNWTKAVWETPLYSMKTKKFKCTGISYNSKTGRVNEINFEEF